MSITWDTQAGSLGTLEERTITEIQLIANSTVGAITYSIIAGSFPRGLRLIPDITYDNNTTTGFIKGSPVEVTKSTISRFVIRASDGVSVSDRTFQITVDGADTPTWITSEGYLQAGISNTHYVLDNSYVNIQLSATDSDITAGGTLSYRLLPNAGEFPPGLTLDSDGLISGFTDPIFALEYNGPTAGGYDTMPWDVIPLDYKQLSSAGYDTYFYDNVTFDYADLQSTAPRLSRDYTFSVEVSDGEFSVSRLFRIYVVTDEFLASQNIGVIRKPLWITKPYLGRYRANNYVTVLLDVYDPPSLQGTITYFLLANNPDGSISELPPGMSYDSMTGDIAGRIPYQARITKSYTFTMLAASLDSSISDAVIVSSTMNTAANQLIFADTSVMSYQLQLPNNPSNGDRLCIIDINNTFAINPVTLESNSVITIENTDSLVLDVTGTIASFLYDDTTSNWVLQYTPIGYIGEITTTETDVQTTNYTASVGDLVKVDSSLSSFTINLPDSPSDNSKIDIIDVSGSLGFHSVNLSAGSGDTIDLDSSVVLDVPGTFITVVYDATINNWNLVYNPVGFIHNPSTLGLTPTALIASNTTAANGQFVRLDCRSNPIDITLPLTPVNGFAVGICDCFSKSITNQITVIPNTNDTIINDDTLVLDIEGVSIVLVYDAPTKNWVLQYIPGNIGTFGLSVTPITPSTIINDINSNVVISSTLVGEWNATTTYNVNDAVKYSGFVYACIVRNTNKSPLNTTYWVSGVATEPRTFTMDIVGEIESAINWITKPSLGTISPNKPSTIKLEAVNLLNSGLSYKLISGKLPAGLTLLQSGFIEGKVRQFQDIQNNLPGLTRFFDYNSNGTTDSTASRSYNITFDGNTTTFDKKHTFTVVAKDSVNFVELPQTFDLTVKTDSELTFANLYVKAFLSKEQRLNWHQFITDDAIFNATELYRYGDPYFGVQTELKSLVFAGIETTSAESYVQAMSRNHTKKQMLFGEVKTAVALDESTHQPIYEVVYVDLVDQFEKNGTSISKIVNLPDNTSSKVLISYDKITIDSDIPFVSDSDKQRVFPNSIKNMRKQIESTGTRDRTYLPLWMRSIQPTTNHEPGHVKALVLCYAKPGNGEIIAARIKAKTTTASRGNWSPNAYYQTGDTVKYFSMYYTSITNNSNTKPTDTQVWSRNFDFKLLNFTADRYIIDTLDGVVSDKYLVFPNHREP